MHPSQLPTGDPGVTFGALPADPADPTLVQAEPASSTTSRQVGDLVQINRADPYGGDPLTGTGQIVEVIPADGDTPAQYRVALVDVVHVPLTDEDFVDNEDRD